MTGAGLSWIDYRYDRSPGVWGARWVGLAPVPMFGCPLVPKIRCTGFWGLLAVGAVGEMATGLAHRPSGPVGECPQSRCHSYPGHETAFL
jgi:hypothetical protein